MIMQILRRFLSKLTPILKLIVLINKIVLAFILIVNEYLFLVFLLLLNCHSSVEVNTHLRFSFNALELGP